MQRHIATVHGELNENLRIFEERWRAIADDAQGLRKLMQALKEQVRTSSMETKRQMTQTEDRALKRQEDEVDEILEIPLTLLLATKQNNVGSHQEKNLVLYWFKHHRIWGASAKILHKIECLSAH